MDQRTTGMLMAFTNCMDPDQEDDYNRCYTETHIQQHLNTGCFFKATHYVALDPEPGDAKHPVIYETDFDNPLDTRPILSKSSHDRKHHPEMGVKFSGTFKLEEVHFGGSMIPAKVGN